MTDRELMQQALDALKSCVDDGFEMWFDEHLIPESIAALRERLAQPEPKPATYPSYGLMGGDEFVSKDSINRMIV